MSQRCSQGMQNTRGCSSAGACKQVCQYEKMIEMVLKAEGLKFQDKEPQCYTGGVMWLLLEKDSADEHELHSCGSTVSSMRLKQN